MQTSVDLFTSPYKNFSEELYSDIRQEVYGEDIGQTSWLFADEFRRYFSLLGLTAESRVLDIASGSGGPALFMAKETGCSVTGIDVNEDGVANARKLAQKNGLDGKVTFVQADASGVLPFEASGFDAVVCIDSINHLKNREGLLREIYRVLKDRGRFLFTDALVMTGLLTSEEIAVRSSLGVFVLGPAGENRRQLQKAGFDRISEADVTENAVAVSQRWYEARRKRQADLLRLEAENNYRGIQRFLRMVHRLSAEGRMSRFLYTAEKPDTALPQMPIAAHFL